jgi:hypothetical protein
MLPRFKGLTPKCSTMLQELSRTSTPTGLKSILARPSGAALQLSASLPALQPSETKLGNQPGINMDGDGSTESITQPRKIGSSRYRSSAPRHVASSIGAGDTRTHRRFRCDKCPQSFIRNHDLTRHKRIHLPVKSISCSFCGIAFSRKDTLKVCLEESSVIEVMTENTAETSRREWMWNG